MSDAAKKDFEGVEGQSENALRVAARVSMPLLSGVAAGAVS